MQVKTKRPFIVTLFVGGVLILTVFNMVRFSVTIAQWDLLMDLAPAPGPFYIAATGLFWTLGWLGVALGLWFGFHRVPPITLGMAILYAAYYWLDRSFAQAPVIRENQVFAVGVTVLFLFITAVALYLPGSRKFFK